MHGPWHMPEHPDEADNSAEELAAEIAELEAIAEPFGPTFTQENTSCLATTSTRARTAISATRPVVARLTAATRSAVITPRLKLSKRSSATVKCKSGIGTSVRVVGTSSAPSKALGVDDGALAPLRETRAEPKEAK